MWCCSSYWGEWHTCRLIPVMKHGTANWFTTWWAFTLYLPPCRLVLPSVCSPSYDHPLVSLTGSVPICLPRYLIPCNHMMLSQRRVVRERDCYSVSAAKILALTPSCCSPDHSPPPLRQLDSILFSKGAETPSNPRATGRGDKTLKERFSGLKQLGSYFYSLDIISMGYDSTVFAKFA